jgi:putative ABC transport system substrate-binding protein
MIKRRDFLLALGAAPFTATIVRAQPKHVRIGMFSATSPRTAVYFAAFERRLGELGYVDGRNLTIDFRYEKDRPDSLPAQVAELVARKCDIIFASGPESNISVAARATTTIPVIIVAVDFDPVATGTIKSLQKPGGNITGISFQQIELTAKRLELLKETMPNARRIAVLTDTTVTDQLRVARKAAQTLGLALHPIEMRNPPYDYAKAFRTLADSRPDALLVSMTGWFFRDRPLIADLALKHRIPSFFGGIEFVEAGGMLSYGASLTGMFAHAADFADKVLKGAKPAEIPAEQPTRFELAVNMKTAKALGIRIPNSIMVRAEKVIE